MIDFTKDDLKALQSWGEVYTQFGACWTTTLHQPLLNKLQSLLDNYCEHKDFDSVSDVDYVNVCNQCGEVVSYD